MNNEDYRDIVPDNEVIKVGKSKLEVKELSIEQTLKLTRFISKKFFDVTKGISELKLKTMNVNDMLEVLITKFNENEFLELLTIITDKDKAWWKKNFKLSAALKVIRKVLEREDIEEVFTEGLQIIQTLLKVTVNQLQKKKT